MITKFVRQDLFSKDINFWGA